MVSMKWSIQLFVNAFSSVDIQVLTFFHLHSPNVNFVLSCYIFLVFNFDDVDFNLDIILHLY